MGKILTESGSFHDVFFEKLREVLYASGGELRSTGENDQHFALDGKLYELKLRCEGDDF